MYLSAGVVLSAMFSFIHATGTAARTPERQRAWQSEIDPVKKWTREGDGGLSSG